MSFFEKCFTYIDACATARAWEIAYTTNRYDIDDYKQDMFLYVAKGIDRFNPERSCPHTFINMLITSAKKNVLRSLNRQKNKIISDARQINYV